MVVLLANTLTCTAPWASSRTGTSATSPGRTDPLTCPILPLWKSSTLSVNEPAFTVGSQKRPAVSVTAISSWMPCGIESHSCSPPEVSRQISLYSSDLYRTMTSAPTGVPFGLMHRAADLARRLQPQLHVHRRARRRDRPLDADRIRAELTHGVQRERADEDAGERELAGDEIGIGDGEVLDALEADADEAAGDADTIARHAHARLERRVAVAVVDDAANLAGAAAKPDVGARRLAVEPDRRGRDVAVGEAAGKGRHLVGACRHVLDLIAALRVGGARSRRSRIRRRPAMDGTRRRRRRPLDVIPSAWTTRPAMVPCASNTMVTGTTSPGRTMSTVARAVRGERLAHGDDLAAADRHVLQVNSPCSLVVVRLSPPPTWAPATGVLSAVSTRPCTVPSPPESSRLAETVAFGAEHQPDLGLRQPGLIEARERELAGGDVNERERAVAAGGGPGNRAWTGTRRAGDARLAVARVVDEHRQPGHRGHAVGAEHIAADGAVLDGDLALLDVEQDHVAIDDGARPTGITSACANCALAAVFTASMKMLPTGTRAMT